MEAIDTKESKGGIMAIEIIIYITAFLLGGAFVAIIVGILKMTGKL